MPDTDTGYRYRLPANLRQQVGAGRIGEDARGRSVVRSGLGMESIERSFLRYQLTGGTNYTGLSSTTWLDLDTTLMVWNVWASGKRPLEVMLTANIASAASQVMALSVAFNGTEVTQSTNGMISIYNNTTTQCITGVATLEEPDAGKLSVSVVYVVSGGSAGVVQVDTPRLYLQVKEI